MEESRTTIKDKDIMPPDMEPERQQYFTERVRSQVGELSSHLGQSLTYCISTFGCQMNARDSEKLLRTLETIRHKAVESEEADFVLYNTCTVRENANLRVYGHLGQLGTYKKKHPQMMVALYDCIMQEKEVVDKIKKSCCYMDLISGTHNILKLAELVSVCLDGRKKEDKNRRGGSGGAHKYQMVVDVWEDTGQIMENLPVERRYPFKSGVNIILGCNNFCNYYIVSYVRGQERSRKPEEIVKEISKMASGDMVEVMSLGQNVNSYGRNLDTPMTFAQLLREVEQIEGIHRIRFMTSHLKDLPEELIQVMVRSGKICRHLHLPLQSGSSEILKKMSRVYTKEQFVKLAGRIKKAVPGTSLTIDIIVGFPGEAEEDFQETLDVVRRVEFDSAFTLIYSKRAGTPAASMEDQIPREEIKDRLNRLLEEVQDISARMCSKGVHTMQEMLAEEVNNHFPDLVMGRLSNNTVVYLPGDSFLIGRLIPVYLEESEGFYYMRKRMQMIHRQPASNDTREERT